MVLRYLYIFALLTFSTVAFAQGYGRKTKDAFPQQPRFEKKFWYFDLGVNYTFPIINSAEKEGSKVADTTYKSSLSQTGKIGFNAAFGRYHMINNLYFFRYWNYGLTYRWLRGDETFNNSVTAGGSSSDLGSGTNTFSDHFAGAHIEINGRNKLSDKSFLQHTLGLSASYAVGSKRTYTNTLPGLLEKTQSTFHSYLYYKLGYGVRMFKKLLVIPTVEVPVMNLYTFNSARPDMPYFNSNYWPFSFSIRFMLCQPFRMKNCPPVDAIGVPEGGSQDQGGEQK